MEKVLYCLNLAHFVYNVHVILLNGLLFVFALFFSLNYLHLYCLVLKFGLLVAAR